MAARIFTIEEIRAVVEAMAGRSEEVTTLKVYAALGKRGSLTTIGEVVKAWKASQGAKVPQPQAQPALDPEAEDAVAALAAGLLSAARQEAGQLWNKAVAKTEATLEPQRERLNAEWATLEAEKLENQGLNAAREERISELDNQVEEMKSDLEKAHEDLGAVRAVLAEVRESEGKTKALYDAAQTELAQARQAIAVAAAEAVIREQQLRDMAVAHVEDQNEIQRLGQDAARLQAELNSDRKAITLAQADAAKAQDAAAKAQTAAHESDAQNRDLAAQVKTLTTAQNKAEDQHKQDEKDLRKAAGEQGRLQTELGAARQGIQEAEGRAQEARSLLDAARAESEDLKAKVATLEAEHRKA